MRVHRRELLQHGLFGGLVLALGGAFGLGVLRGIPSFAPSGPLRSLDAFGFSVVAAAAEAILHGAPGMDPVVIAHRIDETLSFGPPEFAAEMGELVAALDSPLLGLLDLRPRPFLSLSVDGRIAALAAWNRSRLALRRSGAQALKRLCVASHYVDPRSWSDIGYPGPPVNLLDDGGGP